jgi:hypothetical protein
MGGMSGQEAARRNRCVTCSPGYRGRRLLPFRSALALAVAAVLAVSAGTAAAAWTTYRHDAARSGIDPDSTVPVTPSQAWQTPPLDGQVYGQTARLRLERLRRDGERQHLRAQCGDRGRRVVAAPCDTGTLIGGAVR